MSVYVSQCWQPLLYLYQQHVKMIVMAILHAMTIAWPNV